MSNIMTEKEKKIQQALGTLKTFHVDVEAATQGFAIVTEVVEAATEEEAEEIVKKMISDGYKFDWGFQNVNDIDTTSIGVSDVTEEV